ncbi:gamma-glutamyl-gamma-aminobutyrate hydrolase family protein [Morganella morganii]|uniref:Gamma-glutamyl-gamma-aminobutyrate hydrolase family protein n=1 Tax=Morganella morganii TaxID=582 RepID=A0AAE4FI15_MORMO|nr:gamma-glutamyl-gamma-aminobutyrate hydrolase family protein [Morganella morganii]MDS0900459.1 gamma-glutamyl-gamma-aminobutyrate hydrolase family protein [Morganella morganii]QXO58615.1 gamma-glutamyl-gamma-aminobutyrate hydrolase family protein [Morganella morganii]QXO77578.1 gamma-glutamyl-gamma-aminobutyrate hydrolase family protein [Morganella morganii]
MKKILISQRRDHVSGIDEERDGIDVRTPKLLFDLGFLPIPLCSELYDAENYIEAFQADAIFISGGNDIGKYPKRDQLEMRLLDYAKVHNIAVFAICRGTQIINKYCGGSLVPVTGHVATRKLLEGEWAKKYGYTDVNSYHNFAITQQTLGEGLEILATTSDGVVKAIRHKNMPWLGVMWHPEREVNLLDTDKKLLVELLNLKI